MEETTLRKAPFIMLGKRLNANNLSMIPYRVNFKIFKCVGTNLIFAFMTFLKVVLNISLLQLCMEWNDNWSTTRNFMKSFHGFICYFINEWMQSTLYYSLVFPCSISDRFQEPKLHWFRNYYRSTKIEQTQP